MSNPQALLWQDSATGVSEAERGTSNKPFKPYENASNSRIKAEPNGGVFIDLVAYQGQYYAKYQVIAGTWVSYAALQEGLDQYFPRQAGFGAYFVVLDRYFKPMLDPDHIEPGDIFYVPTGLSSWANKKRLTPKEVFIDDYMSEFYFKDIPVKGEGTNELATLMQRLAGNLVGQELIKVLSSLATLRNKDLSEIAKHYDLFINYRSIAKESAAINIDLKPVTNLEHQDYWADSMQLRYGKVVGDVLGIDPVFGALLNPTGGRGGGGNESIVLGKDFSINGFDLQPLMSLVEINVEQLWLIAGWHSVFHDAAGYLFNYQGIGPGYPYIPGDNGDPANELAGQKEGGRYWLHTMKRKELLENNGELIKHTPHKYFNSSPL